MPLQHHRYPPSSPSSTVSGPRSCPSSSSVASGLSSNDDSTSSSTRCKEEINVSSGPVDNDDHNNNSDKDRDKAASVASVYFSGKSSKKKRNRKQREKRANAEPISATELETEFGPVSSYQFSYSWADKFESTSPHLASALHSQGLKDSKIRQGKGEKIDLPEAVGKAEKEDVDRKNDDKEADPEFEFLHLSDYGYKTPPDLFSEAELDIISLDSDDGSEKLIFELDSDEEKELYSSSSGDEEAEDEKQGLDAERGDFEEEEDELPRYENTRIIYDTADFVQPSLSVSTRPKAPTEKKKKKMVSFADHFQSKVDAPKEKVSVDEPLPESQERNAVKPKAKVPSAMELRRFYTVVEKKMMKINHKSVATLSMQGVEEKLRIVGVRDPDSISSCVKKALLEGYLRIEGPQSLLQLICYQRCPGEKCKKIIRVRFLDILRQGDFGGDSDKFEGPASRCVVQCESSECRLPVYVTDICVGEPTLVRASDHHHCRKCSRWGMCLRDAELRHCHNCGGHFHYDLDGIVDLRRFPKMVCDACQLSDAKVCEFVNGLRDVALDPFELRLVGPNQLNPCVLAAIKSRLVTFPRLSSSVSAKVKRKIENRGGILILDKNANVDNLLAPMSLTKQLLNCPAFTGVCFVCSAPLRMSWGEALFLDYDEMRPNEDGSVLPINCPKKNCRRQNYLVEACRGTPRFQSVKYIHSHCSSCLGFGWCHSHYPSHCPRCGHHSAGLKGDHFCEPCRLEMGKTEDFQLSEEERCRILKAAKKRPADCLYVEDNSLATEMEDACQVQ